MPSFDRQHDGDEESGRTIIIDARIAQAIVWITGTVVVTSVLVGLWIGRAQARIEANTELQLSQIANTKQQFESLAADINTDRNSSASQVSVLSARVEALDARLDEVERDAKIYETNLAGLKELLTERFDAVQRRLNNQVTAK